MAYRFLHIALACWVFLSTTGFVLNRHYCRSELRSQAFFVKAENCHAADNGAKRACPLHAPEPACPFHNDHDDATRDCCNDKTYLLQLDEELQQTHFEYKKLLLPDHGPVILTPAWPAASFFEYAFPHYLNYRPPLLVCDRPVLWQAFLC